MGPCRYCRTMIYLDWIAERGYHRECYERHLGSIQAQEETHALCVQRWNRRQRKAVKRRVRRAEIRRIKKGRP